MSGNGTSPAEFFTANGTLAERLMVFVKVPVAAMSFAVFTTSADPPSISRHFFKCRTALVLDQHQLLPLLF